MMTTLERTIANAITAGAAIGRTGVSLASQGLRAGRRLRNGRGRLRKHPPMTFTRTSTLSPIVQTAGEAASSIAVTLNMVQTADLIGMYDEYKINWVKFRLQPRYDPGQSGITNNNNNWVAAACDVTGQVTTPTFVQVTAFDNYKLQPLTTGRQFVYTFRPKAINALQAGNLAINRNDWLILSASGAAVPHQLLLYVIKSLNSSAVLAFDYLMEINFSVRQAS